MFLAVFIYQVFYFLVQYAVLKRIELFYYSMFLLCISVYYYVYVLSDLLSFNFKPSGKLIFSSPQISFQFMASFIYMLFISHYLELHKDKPRAYYWVKYYKYYNLFFSFIFLVLSFFRIESKVLVYVDTLVSQPFSLIVVIMLWRLKTSYSKVVVYGTTCAAIGVLVYYARLINDTNTGALYIGNAGMPMQIGLLLDLFILGYGLSLKAAETDKKLVQTLLENQKIIEVERTRIAKDLHDGLGGLLSGIKLTLSSMKGNVVVSGENANTFNRAINQLDNTIVEMRRVAHSMMPEALLKFGLAEAIEDYCDGINESSAVKIKFTKLGTALPLEKAAEVTIYRIVQELSNNAIKHAQSQNIFIQLAKHERGITLTVEDDGKGFDTTLLSKIKGAGLQNVQSRVDYLKGSLNIETEAGKGTSVNVEIPVNN